jgi:hypothetical protein
MMGVIIIRKHFPACLRVEEFVEDRCGGKTDEEGREVIENKVEIPDFNATIAYALGLPLDEIIYSPTRRPFTLSDKGQPLTQLI